MTFTTLDRSGLAWSEDRERRVPRKRKGRLPCVPRRFAEGASDGRHHQTPTANYNNTSTLPALALALALRPMSPTSIPALLWRWYIDALWNYSPDSWVASTAYTFRLLALIVILPGVLLTLLVRAFLRRPLSAPDP